MTDGQSKNRVHLVANSKSGKGKGATLADQARSICTELGYELVEYEIDDSEQAVQNAENDSGVVIAAGGDGTIRTVAQLAHGKPVRFAVVPCGTFNYFARTHKIPEDHLAALRLALTGEVRPVRLGEVNGHVFLINASLGLYTRIIRDREDRTGRYGRNRIVAILSTIVTMLSDHLLLKVDLVAGGQMTSLRTPMVFIGNNALQLRNLAMSVAHCMKLDLLAVVVMKPVSKLEVLRILFRGIFKTLENDQNIETFCVDELTIYTRKSSHSIALDGEIFHVQSPLKVKSLPLSLNLVLPLKEPEP